MIRFIHAMGPEKGIIIVAGQISESLKARKKVLWLVSGGSNIPVAVEIEKLVRDSVGPAELQSLIVSQTDERFGPVGHADSNWQQMIDTGFDFDAVQWIPVLRNKSLEETVTGFTADIEGAFKSAKIVIGQFGIGADGHIAGVLPHSPAVSGKTAVSGYESDLFTRITLTPGMIERIDVAYVLAFGEPKKKALKDLQSKDLPVKEQPAQVLKKIPEAYVYSDAFATSQRTNRQ